MNLVKTLLEMMLTKYKSIKRQHEILGELSGKHDDTLVSKTGIKISTAVIQDLELLLKELKEYEEKQEF